MAASSIEIDKCRTVQKRARKPLFDRFKGIARTGASFVLPISIGFLLSGPAMVYPQNATAPKAAAAPAKAKAESYIKSSYVLYFSIDNNDSLKADFSFGDLKSLSEKKDGGIYSNIKSLFEDLENGKMNFVGAEAYDMTKDVIKENARVLKIVEMRKGDFVAHFCVETGDKSGERSVAITSNGANGRKGRFFVSEVNVSKGCEIVKAEPFFVRSTEDVEQVGAYLKFKRDGKTYQLVMSVIFSRSNTGLAKTTLALREFNGSDIFVGDWMNRQVGVKQ